MIDSNFFQALPDDVGSLVSQRIGGLPIRPVQADSALKPKLVDFFSGDLWRQRLKQNSEMCQAAESGIWLWFGFLDKAHQICQDIPSAEGSYWHGIMHRIEGDFWNAKYWMRQVGRHPVHQLIPADLNSVFNDSDTAKSDVLHLAVVNRQWDAAGMVDACQGACEKNKDWTATCEIAGAVEWKCLLEHCLSPENYK